MPGFNLQDYQTVDQRLREWWRDHPDGRVDTHIAESHGEQRWTIRAAMYRHADDAHPVASGMAYGDPQGSKGAQATNPLEDAETSAIGRALANAGYSPSGSRPSQEEMRQAQARSEGQDGGQDGGQGSAQANGGASEKQRGAINALLKKVDQDRKAKTVEWLAGKGGVDALTKQQASSLIGKLSEAVEEADGEASAAAEAPTAGDW